MLNSLLLALAVFAGAQNSLPQQIPVRYRDFSGGYVDNVDPVNLQPNESPDLLNVVVDDPVGSLKPRNGFTQCGLVPSRNTATALYEYNKSDGTRRLIVSDNQNVYSTPDCVTWTTIATGLSASAQVHFATVRDKLWVVNGNTQPLTWDGTTATYLAGQANTPNPLIPKCSYIEFWKERVWCGAPSGDLSAVYFSALTDSNGNDLDPSTGTLSWPAANAFQIDQNAGSRLYAIKAYRNRLYALKDNGVWEIGFDNDFQNSVRKTYASVGSRAQTSVAEVDGVLYFTGKDGMYAFDGDQSVRVSRPIDNKFRTLNQPLISQNYKTWTTKSEFQAGTLSSATASDLDGSVTLSSAPSIFTNGRFETGAISPFIAHTTGTYRELASAGVTTDGVLEGVYSASMTLSATGGLSSSKSANLYLFNTAGSTLTTVAFSPDVSTQTLDTTAWNGQSVFLHWSLIGQGPGNKQAEAHIYSASFTAKNQVTFQWQLANDYTIWLIDNVQGFQYESSGTWTSEIYNASSVSSWGSFSATDSGGGGVTYYIRFGANAAAVSAASWQTITPGAVIPATGSDVRIQVRATLTPSSDASETHRVDDVTLSWNSGGANTQKIHAASWKNALWVSASSGTASSNNVVFRRAAPPVNSWTLYDLNIGPMAQFNDVFYAAASTHSAIYRMDYGTNDNGAAIAWHWESKDENFGLPNNAKKLPEMNADYRNNAACNIRMGYVQDEDTNYCVGNFPSTTSLEAGVGSRRLNFSGGPAYTYRFKVCHDGLDQTPTIIGIGAYATPINRRGD